MPPRMIQVRSKTTGEIALVSERAAGYFAADYERVDAQPEANTGPAVAPAQPTTKPTDRRAPAAKTTEEA